MLLVLTALLVILNFEYINGFHDAANAIATVVSTKVLTAHQAVLLAACFNLLGALSGETAANQLQPRVAWRTLRRGPGSPSVRNAVTIP